MKGRNDYRGQVDWPQPATAAENPPSHKFRFPEVSWSPSSGRSLSRPLPLCQIFVLYSEQKSADILRHAPVRVRPWRTFEMGLLARTAEIHRSDAHEEM
jgi:hypothetical protein